MPLRQIAGHEVLADLALSQSKRRARPPLSIGVSRVAARPSRRELAAGLADVRVMRPSINAAKLFGRQRTYGTLAVRKPARQPGVECRPANRHRQHPARQLLLIAVRGCSTVRHYTFSAEQPRTAETCGSSRPISGRGQRPPGPPGLGARLTKWSGGHPPGAWHNLARLPGQAAINGHERL